MKKKNIAVVIAIIIVIGALAYFITTSLVGRKPFKSLQSDDIVSVTAHLLPPDKTIQIESKEELVDLFKELMIFKEDDSWNEMAGQVIFFTLNMSDGSTLEVREANPCLVINGVGYKCKYQPSEDLNAWANALLEQNENRTHK